MRGKANIWWVKPRQTLNFNACRQHFLLESASVVNLLHWPRCHLLNALMSRYLVSFREAKTCLRINWIPTIMVQFCYLRLNAGMKTVSCRLLRPMAWMDTDWNVKELRNPFHFLMLCLQITEKFLGSVLPDEICLLSSLYLYRSILCMG